MPDTPKPKRPYRLTPNDRRLLRALRIVPDEDPEQPDVLPMIPPRIAEDDKDDGA